MLFQVILVISGFIGFAIGYYTQQLSYAIYKVLAAGVFSGLLVIPPWPFLFRKNPVQVILFFISYVASIFSGYKLVPAIKHKLRRIKKFEKKNAIMTRRNPRKPNKL